jgi:hypothetical protein
MRRGIKELSGSHTRVDGRCKCLNATGRYLIVCFCS